MNGILQVEHNDFSSIFFVPYLSLAYSNLPSPSEKKEELEMYSWYCGSPWRQTSFGRLRFLSFQLQSRLVSSSYPPIVTSNCW